MKKLLPIIIFSISITAEKDCSNKNECTLPNNTSFINNIIKNMSLEQKVGQIIMPEINSVTPEQAKIFHFGTILNGGGGFPNQNKDSNIQAWINLSKNYYDASTDVNGLKIPI